jgi:tRNA threonylcarbamoyladenosine biosynthesis protein TsaE
VREELTVASADDMRALGRRLAAVLRPGDLVVLSGALGAGKTTLVQGIGAGLGVRGPVTSPTFVIARVHPSLTGGPALVHADAYRLTTPAEVDDLDLDASLETSVTVVEWGGGLAEGLAADRLEVSIALAAPAARPGGHGGPGDPLSAAAPDQEPRTVRLQGHGARWDKPARATPADAAPASAGPADAPADAAPADATPGGPPE